MPTRSARLLAAAVPVAALVVAATAAPAVAAPRLPLVVAPLATFDVAGEVAEILAATPDGRTVLYTDSAAEEIGAVDISDPRRPRQIATLDVPGEPTSVAVTPDSRYALAVVDTSDGVFTAPSGVLVVVDLGTRAVARTVELGGQPDSITISPDGRYAAVAIENQRDEDIEVGGIEGGLPQLPAGFLAVVDLAGGPATWSVGRVELTGLSGAAFPEDPEPEYVDVNRSNVAAVTLQENNAIALVDLRQRTVVRSFSAGTVTRTDADTTEDGVAQFDDPLTAPREPDAVQWTPSGNLVTADEGDLADEPSGGRGWTVFSPTGRVLYASGGSAERALADAGFYPDDRSGDKGAEFEGAEVARLFGVTLTFIGSERGDAVLGYAGLDDRRPYLLAVFDTGDAPEGLLAIASRGLLLTSNEDEGTISVFGVPRA